jgi:predicted ATPase/class 3 adenylate cyclase
MGAGGPEDRLGLRAGWRDSGTVTAGQPIGTVTLLFSDVEGSTRLLERLGRERYAEALELHRRLLRSAFERHGGYEVDAEGDAFFVAFGSANEAVAAAAEAQQALTAAEWPEEGEIRARMGLHTGEPLAVPPRYVGLDVHKAARIMAAAHGGQVLLSEATRELLGNSVASRNLGAHRLKDLSGPQRLHQLLIAGLPGEFPALKTLERRPTNLPVQPTAFIGRERELDEVAALLRTPELRLVTLTGPGGIGKTRLALHAAARIIDDFPDGCFFVPLAPVRDPRLVVPTIAQTLDLRERPGEPIAATLSEHLREQVVLLVVDNLEQVVEAAPDLGSLLTAAPSLTVLATSREALHVSGEQLYDVQPLALPAGGSVAVGQVESVDLFVTRAKAVDPTFELADGNAEAVSTVVRQLDGLPLAIELAAARVRALTPQAIQDRLGRRLALLTGGGRDVEQRQRTLEATIQWSYDLLSPSEQELFARFGVFVGGFRLEAAEAVCGADAFDGIDSLVDKSLLRRRADPDQRPRYWMLETIREYALATLDERGEQEEVRRRHVGYFVELAEDVELRSRTEDQSSWFGRLDSDVANLRAAFEEGGAEAKVRLASALWAYWGVRGEISEGVRRLEQAVSMTDEAPPRALVGLCLLRHFAAFNTERLLEDAQAAIQAAQAAGDEFALANGWNLLGRLEGSGLSHFAAGEAAWQQALIHAERGGFRNLRAEVVGWLMVMTIFGPLPVDEGIERCRAFLRGAGDDATIRAFAQNELAPLLAMRGEFEQARELLAAAGATFRELGLNVWAANSGQEGFYVEMHAGDARAAASMLRQSYASLDEMGERGFLSTIAGMLAHALCALGEYDEAEAYSRRSQEFAAADDFLSQILWRTARAKAHARRGRMAEAEALAREAIELTNRSPEDLLTSAGAYVDLAEVLECDGRLAEAATCLAEAARRYEAKGDIVALAQARERAERVA